MLKDVDINKTLNTQKNRIKIEWATRVGTEINSDGVSDAHISSFKYECKLIMYYIIDYVCQSYVFGYYLQSLYGHIAFTNWNER